MAVHGSGFSADGDSDFGVLVIDGGEASLARVPPGSGAPLHKVARIQSHIASRTRRGGQSAPRFARSRQLEELEFLRKVAARAAQEFSSVQGIVIGGCANMKHKLVAELPLSLRRRISCIVSLSCSASWTGLQKAASQVSLVRKQQVQRLEGDIVDEFIQCAQAVDTTSHEYICYGETETEQAMDMGAVKVLLICDDHKDLERWMTMATSCGSDTTRIRCTTDSSAMFCSGYRIGAFLRWPVKFSVEMDSDSREAEVDSDSEASTAAPASLENTLPWLRDALVQAGHDDSSAEALTIGVDVVLSCDIRTPDERFSDALELLQSQDVPTEVLEDFCLLVGDTLGDTFSDDSWD